MVYTTKGCTVETEREVSGVPVGTILEVPYGKVHGGCLPCNGGTYDKNLYPDLFQYLDTDVLPLILHETPLGGAKWFPKRSNIHPDFVPADGQLLNRSDYPQVTPIFTSDMVHQATDQQFSSDPLNRGHWMTDLQDTFRVPDMNGKSIDSAGAVFVRGDGAKSNEGAVIQGDAIRNITGTIQFHGSQNGGVGYTAVATATGALVGISPQTSYASQTKATGASSIGAVGLDASKIVPTADENRPLNLAGCWAVRVKETTQFVIKAAGFIENDGLADIAALSSRQSALEHKVETGDRWYISTQDPNIFNKYFGYAPTWDTTRVDEMMLKVSKNEIRITGILRRGSGSYPNTPAVLFYLKNPDRRMVRAMYQTFLISVGITGGQGYASVYTEPVNSTDEVIPVVCGGLSTWSSNSQFWAMFDFTFTLM